MTASLRLDAPSLRYAEIAWVLTVCRERYRPSPDLAEGQVGAKQGQETKLGAGQTCRLTGAGHWDRSDLAGEPVALRVEAEAGAGSAKAVDLGEQSSGRVGVAKHYVGVRELETGLDGKPGEGAGERGHERSRLRQRRARLAPASVSKLDLPPLHNRQRDSAVALETRVMGSVERAGELGVSVGGCATRFGEQRPLAEREDARLGGGRPLGRMRGAAQDRVRGARLADQRPCGSLKQQPVGVPRILAAEAGHATLRVGEHLVGAVGAKGSPHQMDPRPGGTGDGGRLSPSGPLLCGRERAQRRFEPALMRMQAGCQHGSQRVPGQIGVVVHVGEPVLDLRVASRIARVERACAEDPPEAVRLAGLARMVEGARGVLVRLEPRRGAPVEQRARAPARSRRDRSRARAAAGDGGGTTRHGGRGERGTVRAGRAPRALEPSPTARGRRRRAPHTSGRARTCAAGTSAGPGSGPRGTPRGRRRA